MERENNLKVIAVEWIIPMFGNSHCAPYGLISVEGALNDGTDVPKRIYKVLGGTWKNSRQYVIINRHRYIINNEGSMEYPNLYLTKWPKVKINGHWYYHV